MRVRNIGRGDKGRKTKGSRPRKGKRDIHVNRKKAKGDEEKGTKTER